MIKIFSQIPINSTILKFYFIIHWLCSCPWIQTLDCDRGDLFLDLKVPEVVGSVVCVDKGHLFYHCAPKSDQNKVV